MDSYRLQSLLQSVLGAGKRASHQEILFYCPFCSHHNPKLSININSGKWKCWVCNEAGLSIISLLKRMNADQVHITEAMDITKGRIVFDDLLTDKLEKVELPKEFISLATESNSIFYKHAVEYLKNRHITYDDIIKYNIGYCEEGKYQNRIILPSYDNNNVLNFFTARLFFDGKLKYLNPSNVSKDVIIFESLISWDFPLVLCEGIFDAIAIRRNVTPLMGKTLSPKLEKKLLMMTVPIYIALDKDAESDALNIAKKLIEYGKDVRWVSLPKKDPSEIGFAEMSELIEQSQTLTLEQILKRKIFNI